MDQSRPNWVCVLADIENITDVYCLHDSHTGLKLLRSMLKAIDTYLAKYGLVAPIGCRKVFLAHQPPECVARMFEELHYETSVSTYLGKDAADKELLDCFHEVLQTADPQFVSAFLVVSNDQIFAAIAQALAGSPFASVCVGLCRPTRWLSGWFDEVLWFWFDSLGGRLVRRSAKSLETVLAPVP